MDREEFDFQKKLLDIKHKYKMEFSAFNRETENIKHQLELERMRIKTAEIRKSQARKHGNY